MGDGAYRWQRGEQIVRREICLGKRWWSEAWADWEPDPAWRGSDLPAGWEDA